MTDKDRIEILRKSLGEAIAAIEAIMSDPANRSEITPDVCRFRADLEFTRTSEKEGG